jgi:hypothetical protein
MSERGRWFTTSPYAGWTMAVFHPAYVLRLRSVDQEAFERTWQALLEDLKKVSAWQEGTGKLGVQG